MVAVLVALQRDNVNLITGELKINKQSNTVVLRLRYRKSVFHFQYFCLINSFLRFISVQLNPPQEIPIKESLRLSLWSFRTLLILGTFGSGDLQ